MIESARSSGIGASSQSSAGASRGTLFAMFCDSSMRAIAIGAALNSMHRAMSVAGMLVRESRIPWPINPEGPRSHGLQKVWNHAQMFRLSVYSLPVSATVLKGCCRTASSVPPELPQLAMMAATGTGTTVRRYGQTAGQPARQPDSKTDRVNYFCMRPQYAYWNGTLA